MKHEKHYKKMFSLLVVCLGLFLLSGCSSEYEAGREKQRRRRRAEISGAGIDYSL